MSGFWFKVLEIHTIWESAICEAAFSFFGATRNPYELATLIRMWRCALHDALRVFSPCPHGTSCLLHLSTVGKIEEAARTRIGFLGFADFLRQVEARKSARLMSMNALFVSLPELLN